MKAGIQPQTSRRGAALLLSLLAVLAVGAISATLRRVQSTIERDQRFSIDRRTALYVAEAGIAESTLAISQGKSGSLASETIPAAFGAGLYWVDAQDRADGSIELQCTAQVRTAEFVLRTIIVPNLNPITSRGFFGIEGVTIGRGTLVDGFDASLGTYESQVTATHPHRTTGVTGRLGSLGPLDFDGPSGSGASAESYSWVDWLTEPSPGTEGKGHEAGRQGAGQSAPRSDPMSETGSDPTSETGSKEDPTSGSAAGHAEGLATLIHADVDGLVLSTGDAVFEGVIDLDAAGFIPPPVLYPGTAAKVTGDHVVTGSQVGLGLASSVEIAGDLIISTGASLRLSGPLVLGAGVLRLQAGAELQLDDSEGPIHVHLVGGIQSAASTRLVSLADEPDAHGTSIFINPPESPRADLSLPSSGRFHGALYAPGDRIVVPADLSWLGALTALHLETEPGARLSFDTRMATGGQGTAAAPRIASWQIIPVGDGLARRLAVDPKQVLRLQGLTPLLSSAAAPESECEVILLDDAGTPTTYTGSVGALSTTSDRLMSMRWVDPRNGTLRRWMRPTGSDQDHHVSAYREKLDQVRKALKSSVPDGPPLLKPELEYASLALNTTALIKPIPKGPDGEFKK